MPIVLSKPKAATATPEAPPKTAEKASSAVKPATVKATAPKLTKATQVTPVAPKAEISVEIKNNATGETVSHESLKEDVPPPGGVSVVESAPCTVSYSMGYTQGLPGYCAAKGTVFLAVPCRHDEIDQTADYVREWVNGRTSEMAAELMAMAETEAPAETPEA